MRHGGLLPKIDQSSGGGFSATTAVARLLSTATSNGVPRGHEPAGDQSRQQAVVAGARQDRCGAPDAQRLVAPAGGGQQRRRDIREKAGDARPRSPRRPPAPPIAMCGRSPAPCRAIPPAGPAASRAWCRTSCSWSARAARRHTRHGRRHRPPAPRRTVRTPAPRPDSPRRRAATLSAMERSATRFERRRSHARAAQILLQAHPRRRHLADRADAQAQQVAQRKSRARRAAEQEKRIARDHFGEVHQVAVRRLGVGLHHAHRAAPAARRPLPSSTPSAARPGVGALAKRTVTPSAA